jgi:SAM-dependent methyltransferase
MLDPMATPWDRAAERYLEEWVPRFVPYHLDLVRELAVAQGQRVLVVTSGPGAEVVAVARAVGDGGLVRATDPSPEMVRICGGQLERAGFTGVTCEQAGPRDVGEGAWDAIVCAFGLWAIEDRGAVLEAWKGALAPSGKVGVLTFGPCDDADPFEILRRALADLEPALEAPPPRVDAGRDAVGALFEAAGLALVRHTVLRHTVAFPTAEAFIGAISEGRTWRRVKDELGAARFGRVTARFYDKVGGPTEPLTFEPPVTLAVGALPGAEVELLSRPSIRVPALAGAGADRPAKA